MKKAVILSLLILALLSSLTVCAWADGGDAFEPVTVVDDDTVKIVVTELSNSPADGAASFTLEIENKTDMGLEFSLFALSANDRLCDPSSVEVSKSVLDDEAAVDIPAGETGTISAGWERRDLAQVGVNHVEKADGYFSVKWDNDYYMKKYNEAGDDSDAQIAVMQQYYDFELQVPFSLPFSPVSMDIPATEEVIYDTDFEPVVFADDESITAVVHDYFYDHGHDPSSDNERGPSLVLSFENKANGMRRLSMQKGVNGNYTDVQDRWLPPGKTLIEAINFSASGDDSPVEPSSVDSITLSFMLFAEDYLLASSGDLNLDVSAYADSTSSIFGTAAWVESLAVEETAQSTASPSAEVEPSADVTSSELYWIPDPEADAAAMTTLGDNGEYLLGMTFTDEVFHGYQALFLYFKNNSSDSIEFYSYNVMLNGSPFPDNIPNVFGGFSKERLVPPGGAINFVLMDVQPPFPTDGFSLDFDIDYVSADHYVIAKDSISATVSETGEVTITSVN